MLSPEVLQYQPLCRSCPQLPDHCQSRCESTLVGNSNVDEDVQSLSQFSTELVVEATAMCLKLIKNDLDLPHKLPPSMSARFRVGTSLATAVQVNIPS